MPGQEVALLGVGAWGRNHLRVLLDLGVLRRAWDPDPAALSRVPEHARAASLEEVLDDDAVHAVVVASPARTHHELARACLERGKDVLVEKPLTLDVAAGERLVELARDRGRILMVGHVLLYHPAVAVLRACWREGRLGAVRYVYSNRLNLGTVREEEDILWSFAPHDVALLLHLSGEHPVRVSATGGGWLRSDRADVTVTHLGFPGGLLGHIFVSWLHPFKEHRLVVVGERRMAVFTDGARGGELRLYARGLEGLGDGRAPERGAGELLEFPRCEPLREELVHFLACVAERRPPLSGGAHGVSVLRILETARESLAEGGVPLQCAAAVEGLG